MTPSDPTTVPLPADLLAAEEQMLQACLAAIGSGDGRRWSASLRFETRTAGGQLRQNPFVFAQGDF